MSKAFRHRIVQYRNDESDAATDVPVALLFPHLDTRFHRAKLIFTVCDKDNWFESARRTGRPDDTT